MAFDLPLYGFDSDYRSDPGPGAVNGQNDASNVSSTSAPTRIALPPSRTPAPPQVRFNLPEDQVGSLKGSPQTQSKSRSNSSSNKQAAIVEKKFPNDIIDGSFDSSPSPVVNSSPFEMNDVDATASIPVGVSRPAESSHLRTYSSPSETQTAAAPPKPPRPMSMSMSKSASAINMSNQLAFVPPSNPSAKGPSPRNSSITPSPTSPTTNYVQSPPQPASQSVPNSPHQPRNSQSKALPKPPPPRDPATLSQSSSTSSLPQISPKSPSGGNESESSTVTGHSVTMQSLPSNPVWPRIQLLTCGGTIAQRASSDGKSMTVGGTTAAEILSQTKANVNWSHRTISTVLGSAMTISTIFALRDHIVDAQNEFDGFVITTGTDSLEEVAFLLDRILYGHIKVGVVITGAMKPSDISGYDGPANVEAAARVLSNPASKSLGVLVVENNTIHCARYVHKADSALIGSFQSRNTGPIGHIRGSKAVFYYTGLPPHAFTVPLTLTEERVSKYKVVIWTMALEAFFPEIILHEIDGLVIAGQGTGSISAPILSSLAAYSNAIKIILTTRCVTGSNYDDWYYKGSLEKYENVGIHVATYEGYSPVQCRLLLMLNMALDL